MFSSYFFVSAILGSILNVLPISEFSSQFHMILFKKTKSFLQRSIVIWGKRKISKIVGFFGLKSFLSASYNFYSQNIDIELRKCTSNQFHLNEFPCTFPNPPFRRRKTGKKQFYISYTQKPARVKWFVIPVSQLNACG